MKGRLAILPALALLCVSSASAGPARVIQRDAHIVGTVVEVPAPDEIIVRTENDQDNEVTLHVRFARVDAPMSASASMKARKVVESKLKGRRVRLLLTRSKEKGIAEASLVVFHADGSRSNPVRELVANGYLVADRDNGSRQYRYLESRARRLGLGIWREERLAAGEVEQ